MRIFVAGAAGAIGKRLVPMLVQRGHQVHGTTRSPEHAELIQDMGATPVTLDALHRDQVMRAVIGVKPEVIVHELTGIGAQVNLRRFDDSFAMTNRLRTEATDYLLDAAVAAGVPRFVAQSYTGWPNERTGAAVKTEHDPIDPHPTPASRQTVAAIRHVEAATTSTRGVDGVALRYGGFYGPGTDLGKGGSLLEMVRKRRLPIVGGGTGIWSFVHMDDAAAATVLAIESQATGIFNIVDDEPAQVKEWLPYLAEAIGAKQPWRVPAWLVRPLLGAHGVSLMTVVRGSSNAKARKELGWEPRYRSWREGFRTGL